MVKSRRYGLTATAALLIAALGAPISRAGGGPQNVFLVVNPASTASLTIANHFQELRDIPPGNVMYLDWRGNEARTDVNTLRQNILKPILEQLEARGIAQQIDYIVYSSGYPWNVNFSADIPPSRASDQIFQNPEGSLTGLTYLFNSVLGRDAGSYASRTSNRYMRLREATGTTVSEINVIEYGAMAGIIPNETQIRDGYKKVSEVSGQSSIGSHGFKAWYGWGPNGETNEAGGVRYMLSTCLGVTFGRGNTIAEIIDYLKRSAPADGTMPKGTIYFMDNTDVRSTTRRPGFPMAVEQLKKLGVKAEVMNGDIPVKRPDVQGLLSGIADLDWGKSGSIIRPGAICENFTSFGGIFDPTGYGQTPLSVFLRYGAAGSSGTVVEPFSIQNKFPHAMIQVHYARGCTLAEAFYESVYSPYQLIIVGDPLCRPWANIPQISFSGAKSGDVVKGQLSLRPVGVVPRGGIVDRFELFIDGKRADGCGQNESLELDTAKYCDGDHRLRIVGTENSAIETQGSETLDLRFDNFGKTIQFEMTPKQRAPSGSKITLKASAPGAIGVAFYRNRQVIGKFTGESGETTVDTRLLGDGPVSIQAIGWGSANPAEVQKHVCSPWVPILIESAASGQ